LEHDRVTILAIIQARMSSTRLPGKVLKPIIGRPMLELQLERLRRARLIDTLIVATSDQPDDDPIATLCEQQGIGIFRGSLSDVLGRYHGALSAFGPADHVVRLTADCPLADPDVIDGCIVQHLADGADYTSNGVERTFPRGLDVEVMTAVTLERAHREATALDEREHVTMHLYRNQQTFQLSHFVQDRSLGSLRWTVDTPEDLEMVRAVYLALYAGKPDFRQADILRLLLAHPEIAVINANAG
jgi:spore coat polysaccharide biosynthesis protein SpsF